MKINGKIELKGLDDKPIPTSATDTTPFTAGRAIANILIAHGQCSGFDSFKAYETAKKFYQNDDIELDKADFDAVKKAVEGDKNYLPLVIGQLVGILREVKDAGEKV